MYFIANWFNLADEACEDALYDVEASRNFCRIDLGRERVPDATTLLNFRHLLEQNELGAALFAKVGELLLGSGLKLSGGTIVDATIIAAPQFHQECGQGARSGDAPNQEGQPVVLRYEGAYRRRQQERSRPQRERHARQRA